MRNKRTETTRVRQALRDAALLLGMFAVAQYAMDRRVPSADDLPKIAAFLVGYVICATALGAMGAEYEDALPRGAAVVIAAKFVNGLSPN